MAGSPPLTGHWTLGPGVKQTQAEAGEGNPLQINIQLPRSLASWGFENCILERETLRADTLICERPLLSADITPELDYGQLVVLRDPLGRQRFVGRRVIVPSQIASAEAHTYQFAGPWWWMERLVYHQFWQQLLINGALVPRQTSHLLLNAGGISVGEQIRTVAQYAIDNDAPFQLGTIDIPVVPYVTEVTDQTCAQIVIDQLRWAPDAVAWFDYETNPPTFHCRQSSNLTAYQLNLGPNNTPTIADAGLNIVARPDLQVPSVALRYERTDTKDGAEYLSIGEDIAPPGATGRELNALSQTITLIGFNVTTLRAAILCETINTASLDWWKRVIPELQERPAGSTDPRVINVSLVAGSVERKLQGSRTTANPSGTNSSAFGQMLVEGQLANWMRIATNDELDWEQEELSAQFTFDMVVDAGPNASNLEKGLKKRIAIHLVSTNAPTGVSSYSTTESEEQGEAQPVGLAAYLYQSLSGLEHEGRVTTVEQECSGYIGPGNVLNIGGTAQSAYASMRARVQGVTESIDAGRTVIRFGPTPALSVGAILELLRASRHRRRWTRTSTQEDGQQASSTTAELGEATANSNTVPGAQQRTLFATHDAGKRVELDATNQKLTVQNSGATQQIVAALEHLAGVNKQAQFRETLICEMVNGVPTQKRCWILRTIGE